MNLTRSDVEKAIEQIQYLYKLKQETRYDQKRSSNDQAESVAEHVWGMHVLATYFLPLENPEGSWNRGRIMEMITWHDIDEVETGDTVSFHKDRSVPATEGKTAKRVIEKAPSHMQPPIFELLTEYERQETIEAKFVKAIDKIEPVFHLMNDQGKAIMHGLNTRKSDHIAIREKYVAPFPFIKFFHEVSLEIFTERGCFVDS